jgi:hypothetical protein
MREAHAPVIAQPSKTAGEVSVKREAVGGPAPSELCG